MTAASVLTTPTPARPDRTRWRPIALITWLQHRTVLLGAGVVALAFAAAIVAAGVGPRAAHARYLADGCPARVGNDCATLANTVSAGTTGMNAIATGLLAFAVLIGMFVAAPMLAREIESGTFRFAWTQSAGRTRVAIGKLTLVAGVTAVVTAVLGRLAQWQASPMETMGVASAWDTGQFNTTWLLLTAWTLLSLAVGTVVGLLLGRTVEAMAATGAVIGGLLVAMFAGGQAALVGVAAKVSQRPLSDPVPGDWIISSWYTGPDGHRLSNPELRDAFQALMTDPSTAMGKDPVSWLTAHHYGAWVSYQPAERFWVFQSVQAAILLALAALAVGAAVRLLNRRR